MKATIAAAAALTAALVVVVVRCRRDRQWIARTLNGQHGNGQVIHITGRTVDPADWASWARKQALP